MNLPITDNPATTASAIFMNATRSGLLLAIGLLAASCQTPPPPDRPSSPPPPTPQPHSPTRPTIPSGTVSEISLETAFTLHSSQKAFWIDARPAFVHAFGHIPGSRSLPRRSTAAALEAAIPELRQAATNQQTLIVYCTDLSCPDARALAEKLTTYGFNLTILEGGYARWTEAGLPTE